MIRALALMAALTATPAHALSCAAPGTLSDAFRSASASQTSYVLVAGAIAQLGGQQRAARENLQGIPQPFTAKARLSGVRAGANGFDQRFNEIITVDVSCAAQWCGAVPTGGVIAFLERRGDTHILHSSPCPSALLHRDSPPARAELSACLAGQCPR